VIISFDGECLGAVGPFELDSPWWADVEPVVAHLRTTLGVPVVVLRLVDVDGGISPREGHVTYHAEALTRPAVALPPPTVDCAQLWAPAPRRARWASAAGVQDALQWVDSALAAADRPPNGPVEQVKTWNLSVLLRFPTGPGAVWLKATPEFMGYEADAIDIIARIDPAAAPVLLAGDRSTRRVLLEHVPGEDCWEASPELIREAVTRWVAIQAGAAGTATSLPRRPASILIDGLRWLLDGDAGGQLTGAEMARARGLLGRLPGIVAELDGCGLPETLVHGDFHPGNWRSDGTNLVFVDFADAHWGQPAVDGLGLYAFLPPERRDPVIEAWSAAWASHVPAADPRRALALAKPLVHLYGAVIYQTFLDNIETSERRYHEGDPAASIRHALAAG
jgi:hypothetical protein